MEGTFSKKLQLCGVVLAESHFWAQGAQILNPTDAGKYAELKQSTLFSKYRPDNVTLFRNPYTLRNVTVRNHILDENYVVTRRKHFLEEFVITCLGRRTEEPHHIVQFFLSPMIRNVAFYSFSSVTYERYVFAYDQRDEMVVVAKVKFRDDCPC